MKNSLLSIHPITTNGWVSEFTEQLIVFMRFHYNEDPNILLDYKMMFSPRDPLLIKSTFYFHYFSISPTLFYLLIALLVVLIISATKPLIETSVTNNKWIYFISLYVKIGWIAFAAVKMTSKIESNKTYQSQASLIGPSNTLRTLNHLSTFMLYVLMTTTPFEFFKLVKRYAYFQRFFLILSVVYGAVLSMQAYLFLIASSYFFLSLSVYTYFERYMKNNFIVFLLEFTSFQIDLSSSSTIDNVVYNISLLIRYILWLFLLTISIFYFRIVSTHLFPDFEPRFFKNFKEKAATISKAVDNFNNQVLLKPTATSKLKGRKVVVWLNFRPSASIDDRQIRYSHSMEKLFDETTKKNIAISFFNDHREVMSFIKSIYNIIPKLIMSTTKSVRIVVNVVFLGKVSRTEFELEIFLKLNELDQLIEKMGLDTEILVFEENNNNISQSKIYSILENSFSKINVSNRHQSLTKFCQMMNIEDISPAMDVEEEFNNLLDGIEEIV